MYFIINVFFMVQGEVRDIRYTITDFVFIIYSFHYHFYVCILPSWYPQFLDTYNRFTVVLKGLFQKFARTIIKSYFINIIFLISFIKITKINTKILLKSLLKILKIQYYMSTQQRIVHNIISYTKIMYFNEICCKFILFKL